MAHRNVEILIGRLLTDDGFRRVFAEDPRRALGTFAESGYELTEVEIGAVTAIALDSWDEFADRIDPRLRKFTGGRS